MAPRADQAVIDALVEDARRTMGTAEGAIRRLAKRHGVSTATVQKYTKQVGLECGDTAREQVKQATRAKNMSNAARMAALAERFLDIAERALSDTEQTYLVHTFAGPTGMFVEHVIPRPPAKERQHLIISAATAVDKVRMIEDRKTEASASEVDRWLASIAGTPGEGSK